ncbi:hypothetical protein SASPL_155493 (mitochondrion) [Salvia splendens]|uniref:Uncharacterized protein n=1 Tax=Salvia splendens TaxID=180675 RepID=A0A8X8VWW3_SALSN|nr:hypothetical protein SASPL_156300 [Salvia splendens]KAG6384649.1 hypothetical protein SASPL_155493 [Salvia splendens]
MARKGNPISVRLDLNRSSDSSWFSEGDRERKVTEWKTTERHPGLEHVVKEAHWAGVLRPCLRGTVECRYHEREVQDTRPRNPGNHSPMCQSLAHPGPRRPAQLERPSLI